MSAEAARMDERARESLRVVREAEADYLAGRDRLEALEREVRSCPDNPLMPLECDGEGGAVLHMLVLLW